MPDFGMDPRHIFSRTLPSKAGRLLLLGLTLTMAQPAQARMDEQQIQHLLSSARADIRAQRLSTPVGNNALYKLRSILQEEPDNTMALELLRRAARTYVDFSERLLARGEEQKAVSYIFMAQALFPEDGRVREQDQALTPDFRAEVEAYRRRWIAETLSKGDENLAEDRLTRPSERNALYRYRQVLDVEPDNSRALKGLRQVADRLLMLSKQPGMAQNSARSLYKKALWIEQNHPGLPPTRHPQFKKLADPPEPRDRSNRANSWQTFPGKNKPEQAQPLRREASTPNALTEAPAARKSANRNGSQTENQLGKLLRQGEQALKRDRLTVPYDMSALRYYREALLLDNNSRAARLGMERIVTRLLQLARESGDEGKSARYIDRAASILPNHPGVLATRQSMAKPTPAPAPAATPASTMAKQEPYQPPQAHRAIKKFSETQRAIQLLVHAADHLRNDRLTRPAGRNALEGFRQVLAIDPSNKTAQEGIRSVANRLLELAEKSVLTNPKRSMAMLRKAHELDPQNSKVINFYQRMAALPELADEPPLPGQAAAAPKPMPEPAPAPQAMVKQAAASPSTAATQQPPPSEQMDLENRVEAVLIKAHNALRNDRLTLPPNRNARDLYAQVLRMDLGNPVATQGLRSVAARLNQLAQQSSGNPMRRRLLRQKAQEILADISAYRKPAAVSRPTTPATRPGALLPSEMQVTPKPEAAITPSEPPRQSPAARAVVEPTAAVKPVKAAATRTPAAAPSQPERPKAAPIAEQKRLTQPLGTPPSTPKSWTDPVTKLSFSWVPAGCFNMGSDVGDEDEKPRHHSCVSGFWMAKHEVTQGVWKKVMGKSSNPSKFPLSDQHPVDNISWLDTREFISRLNKLSNSRFRLPTEAEWEYACRSGGQEEVWSGSSMAYEVAWISQPGDKLASTQPVGRKRPNGFGLYDMSGNVYEWVQDWFDPTFYGRAPQHNPVSDNGETELRLLRGGAWLTGSKQARCSDREWLTPDHWFDVTGFRLVRAP
uniref:Sulfatase-modifying factor enzyme-like domain-containing protein n=1 Tax=Magnetococcus massalia (strain MO-1) TaxID=451514 RepID=A0A1S7LCT4_MAGMO|nr:conserved exported protein of unknown function [Candidatus Magnetococcus massalia]